VITNSRLFSRFAAIHEEQDWHSKIDILGGRAAFDA
jgi:hypothetical protein